jgi:hypothetical protein
LKEKIREATREATQRQEAELLAKFKVHKDNLEKEFE